MAQYRIDPKGFYEFFASRSRLDIADAVMSIASSMLDGKPSSVKWITRINKSKKSSGKYTEDFLLFWKEYPRKTGKGAAFSVWESLCDQDTSAELLIGTISALSWQRHSKAWVEGFIPLPETYLRQRRFEDEPDKQNSSKTSKVY